MSKNMHRVFLFFGMYDHWARTYPQTEDVDKTTMTIVTSDHCAPP